MLPRQHQPLSSGFADRQGNATSSFTNEISKIVGVASDLSRRLRRWTTPTSGQQKDTDLSIQVRLHLGHGADDDLGTARWTPVLGAARDIPASDKREGVVTLNKLINFGRLEDIPAVKVVDGTASVTSAQIMEIRDAAAEMLRKQLQQIRNDKSQCARDRLSPSNDPHGAKLFQHIRSQRVPTPTTMIGGGVLHLQHLPHYPAR